MVYHFGFEGSNLVLIVSVLGPYILWQGLSLRGDLGEILALGAEFRPILVSERSGSLLSAHHRQALMSV